MDVPLPGRLARRGAAGARGAHGRARACGAPRSCSTNRPSDAATPSASRPRAPGSGSRSPAPRASRRWPRSPTTSSPVCAAAIPTCSCTSGSASRRGRSRSRARALDWDIPVLANSALMFGYARPDWRDGYAGWEYVDTIADDNVRRAALRELSPRAGGGPIGCAAYDMGRLLGEGDRAVRSSDPCRHRRRPAPGEATPGDERLRRHAHGIRHLGARRTQGSLPRAARVARRPERAGPTLIAALTRTMRRRADRPSRRQRAQLAPSAQLAATAPRSACCASRWATCPVPLVARATTQLRRFFSGGSWAAEDDAALAAAVGPGHAAGTKRSSIRS